MTQDSAPARTWPLHSKPPAAVLWPAALQHVGLGSATLVMPLIVADAAGADPARLAGYLSLAMLALGLTTLLQAWGRHGIGSGFLLPGVFTAIYLPPSIVAAQQGGLGAVAGLTLVAGLTQILLALALRRLRPLLPTELVGLVVLLVGIGLGLLGLRLMLGIGPGYDQGPGALSASLVTLGCIVAASVWGGARLRSMAVLAGLAAGIATHVGMALWFGHALLPVPPSWAVPAWRLEWPSITWPLLPGAAMGGLACLARVCGDVVACQRATDPAWRRPDFSTMRAGGLADGIGTLLAGAFCLPGSNSFSGSVGLAIATGVMARRVAQATGALWIGMALLPGSAALVLAIPRGVLGAALFFAAAFVISTGMGIITQRLMDARRTLVVGAALLIGLAYDAVPQMFSGQPAALRLLVPSSLVLGMVVALLLVAAFRLGQARQRQMLWHPADGAEALRAFARQSGAAWGARAEVVARLDAALEEAAIALSPLLAPGAALALTARFDELSLDATLRWTGSPLPQASVPGIDDAEDAALDARLATLLLRRAADRVSEEALSHHLQSGDLQQLQLHFEH